jgi:ubiquinone/menaquinone biosynthesis C-methylase UbiE
VKYPKIDEYQELYARYISANGRSVTELVDMAGDLDGKQVLDLCGGAGEIAVECARRGAKVLLVDREHDMVKKELMFLSGVSVRIAQVENLLWLPEFFASFDVVFCRQAVNYWMTDELAFDVSQVLKPGGQFIFNTFNTPPPTVPQVLKYSMDEGKPDCSLKSGPVFVEIFYLVGNMVNHCQCREGLPMHLTQFRWITPEEFDAWLSPHFKVEVARKQKTDLYLCKKL